MQTLHISRQELHTRGGVLDRMLDSLFDTAILVDTDCRILYISASSFPDPSQRAAVVGQHISVLDQLSPFEEVLRTGQPRPDLFLELHGRPCISSLFPVLDGERVIGVVGTITVRNLGRLKKVLSQLSDQAAGFRGLYQDLARVDSGYRLEDFVGESPRVADLLDKARKAAHSGESVLILGETGTGKEIIASGIHAERHGGRPLPYVTINCTAIPEQLLESELFGHEKGAFTGATEARMGKFQLAGDGDLLLDEIGDMDLQMQSKLLRVLESREFERVGGREIIPLRAGIIASTNQNLLAMSERRAFRADLYYRLSTIELYLPPLRARPEDIPLLIDRLCAQKGGRLRLTHQAMEYLQRYTWPGNVRQLKNLVGRWLVFYDGVQITGRHVVDELTIGQRSYNEAFGVTDPLAGTASPSGPASAYPLDTRPAFCMLSGLLPFGDHAEVLEGQQDAHRPPQHIPLVHGAQGHVPAVTGVVAVVAHDEDGALRHLNMGLVLIGGTQHGLMDVGLVQHLSVRCDGARVVVDVHRLSAHGDDPLDDGPVHIAEGLGEHHHIPLLGLIADALEQQHVPVVQRGIHGAAVHADDAPHEGEEKDQRHQGQHQGLEPEVEIQLEGVAAGELLLLLPVLCLLLCQRYQLHPNGKKIVLLYPALLTIASAERRPPPGPPPAAPPGCGR